MPFDLNAANAAEYLVSQGLVDPGSVGAVELLGWGVSNTVVKVATTGEPLVIKQSLPQLRVAQEWFADRERVFLECACIRTLSRFLPPGTIPRLLHEDRDNYLFVMSCAPENSSNWKEQLLQGEADPQIARQVGELLGTVHRSTNGVESIANEFADQAPFVQLRIDPYHRSTAKVHPGLAETINREARRMLDVKTVLVHGDYSPKNVMVAGGRPFLLDFEVAHYGNPVFDLAFMLNHLLLKAVYNASIKADYFNLARQFWLGYCSQVQNCPGLDANNLEGETVSQMGCLMLARIDGKSPVEYIEDPATQDLVRSIASTLLIQSVTTLADAIGVVTNHLARFTPATGRAI